VNAGAASVLASLLEARTGQQIAANRAWRIEAALRPLLATLSLDHVDQLMARLFDGQDPTIADKIVDALLNQETSFFRDAGVIETAAAFVSEACGTSRRPRVWSAACATGQEPLSLAMLFAERGGALPEIIATDVSSSAISRGRSGTYNQFEIQRGLPIRRMMQWFENTPEGNWVASPILLGAVSYRRHNLVADPAPVGQFDLILCRNVLFYLVPALRERVLERLARALAPGGLLLLGAGETVIGHSELLRPSQRARGFYEAAEPVRSTPPSTPPAPPRLYTTG
jgi:chemotaxis protein methyltransferase CheR